MIQIISWGIWYVFGKHAHLLLNINNKHIEYIKSYTSLVIFQVICFGLWNRKGEKEHKITLCKLRLVITSTTLAKGILRTLFEVYEYSYTKETASVSSWLLFWTKQPLNNGTYSYRKECAPRGRSSFLNWSPWKGRLNEKSSRLLLPYESEPTPIK